MSTSQPVSIDLGDLSLIEVLYKIGGNDFILKEASGDAACHYRNAMTKDMVLGPDGKPTKFGNLADVEPLLVSLCLFNVEGRRINVNEVRKWPNRVIKALFNKVKEISELGEEPEERRQLEEILDSPNSPCKFSELRKFVETFGTDDYSVLKSWMEPLVEETAKNEQSG